MFPIALAVAALLSSCGPGSGRCDARRRGAALVTPHVVVYGSKVASRAATAYYACLRPAGRPVEIGIDERGSLYGSDATAGGFGAAGSYVVAQSSTGEAALALCARYNDTRRCTPDRHWLTAVNLDTGRRAHVPIYTSLSAPAIIPFPVAITLSPDGAVAWLEHRVVGARVTDTLQLWATALAPRGRRSLAAAPSMLDAGPIDPSPVRFEGLTLYWIRVGQLHHLKLRRASHS
jgi:hypothetical protein